MRIIKIINYIFSIINKYLKMETVNTNKTPLSPQRDFLYILIQESSANKDHLIVTFSLLYYY